VGAQIHHLNCGTLCPFGKRMLSGEGSLLAKGELVCHVLLVEGSDELTLVDTGFGSGDIANPRRLGRPFLATVRPELEAAETAAAQLPALGFSPSDVRQIVVTHLDLDHAGGLGDFPDAEVHVFAPEHAAAMEPSLRERPRYIGAHWAHGPKWATHEVDGDEWMGFEAVRLLPGAEPEVLMIPLIGHSRGHTGIAVRRGEDWLLHAGDAFFHHGDIEIPRRCPPGLRGFQNAAQWNGKLRHQNRERLAELARDHAGEVHLVCSHDPTMLASAQAAAVAPAG
jgi:glyoxylase-like metal-dependent hydrolase (beta-lactamase superfamily II)